MNDTPRRAYSEAEWLAEVERAKHAEPDPECVAARNGLRASRVMRKAPSRREGDAFARVMKTL